MRTEAFRRVISSAAFVRAGAIVCGVASSEERDVLCSVGVADVELDVRGDGFADACLMTAAEPVADAAALMDLLNIATEATHGGGECVLAAHTQDDGAGGLTTRDMLETLTAARWRPSRIVRYGDGQALVLARKA